MCPGNIGKAVDKSSTAYLGVELFLFSDLNILYANVVFITCIYQSTQ